MADDKDKEKPAPKKPAAGNVFDVRRPGKTPASPTSRPVILGHKPEAEAAQAAVSGIGEAPALTRRKIQIMPSGDSPAVDAEQPAKLQIKDADGTPVSEKDQDALATAALDAVTGPPALPEVEHEEAPKPLDDKPLEAPEEKPSGEEGSRPAMLTKPKLVIQPLSEGAKADTEEPRPDAEPTVEAKSETEETSSADTTDPKPEPDTGQPAPAAAEKSPAPSVGEESALSPDEQKPAETVTQGEGQEGAEGQKEEEQKPEPHIEPLFDEHGVVASNHDEHHHRNHGLQAFLLALLILILAAAALDILLDLNVLDLPNIPHTDLL